MTNDWLNLPVIEFELTDVDPDTLALLYGPQSPVQTHAVQVDYQVPIKLRWWSRVWLWARRKPAPMVKQRLVIPNASATVTDPRTAGQP